jgi:hypothetical protein
MAASTVTIDPSPAPTLISFRDFLTVRFGTTAPRETLQR